MFHHLTIGQLTIAAIVFVVVAIAVVEYLKQRKIKTAAFRNRFGSEYDRAVLEHGSQKSQEKRSAA